MNQYNDVSFRSYIADSAYLDATVRVYMHTWGNDDWEGSHAFFAKYAKYPNFHGLVAIHNEEVIGFGFGTRSQAGQWWHDRVALQVGKDNLALQDAWVLVELAVLPAFRNRKIGGNLLASLLGHVPLSRALLSTQRNNTKARRFYERHGWQYLHHGFAFQPFGQEYVVMNRGVQTQR